MPKYKVLFSGFAYIEAENADEAEDLFNNDEFDYMERSIEAVEEVDDFVIEV